MNRLNKLLFAGTLVPAIALTPFAGAFAQVPDQQRPRPNAGQGTTHQGASHEGMAHEGMSHEGMSHGGEGHPGQGAMHAQMQGGMARQKAADAPMRTPRPTTATADHAAPTTRDATPRREAEAPQERAPRATDTGIASTQRPLHEAVDPNARLHHNGMTGEAHHAGAPMPADRNAAAPPAMGARPTNAAQDEGRPASSTAAERGNDQRANDLRAQDQRAQDQRMGNGNRDRAAASAPDHHNGLGTGGAVAIGAVAGFAGGFIAATAAQHLDEIRGERHEMVEDGRTYIREPGRTIVEDGNQSFIVHDENDRFRELGYNVRQERQGNDYIDTIDRPGGVQIITYTDPEGRMLRRVRRGPDGREFVLIDNGVDGHIRSYADDVVDLPPPPMRIPRERYVVDYQNADEGMIYDTLVAPPLAPPPQRYTLDQIRYSPDVRSYVRSVDINTINFDSGSWTVPGEATGKLEALASAIKRAVGRNANSVFLVEGYTDATGNPTDNLSLSDRRAQSVAAILTKSFNVPPENLTTQGYGQQNPKVNTSGPSAENRRVVVRNITQLLASGNQAPPQE